MKDFVAEAEDILDNLDESVSVLVDLDPDDHRKPDIINAIFRHAHSLKGLSGMFSLENLSTLSHRLENILDSIRLGRVELSDQVVEILGQGVQKLTRMVRAVGEGSGDGSVSYSDLIRDLENMEKEDKTGERKDLSAIIHVSEGLTEMLSEYEEHRFRDNIAKGAPFFRISCSFPLETFDVELERLGSAIKEMGELLTTLPEADIGGSGKIGFTLYFTSKEPEDKVQEKVDFTGQNIEAVLYQKSVRPQLKTIDQGAVALKGDDGDSFEEEIKGVSQTVRVDISKLDHLMNLVGELVILKSGYSNFTSRLRESGSGVPRDIQLDLIKNNSNMEKKLVDLRDAVMDIRMVPMGQLYNRLQRVSKKIARELGKKVDLEFLGHATELDKMIMEELVSPLLHIVRNSLDHGIESAAIRRSKGKKETGKIRISAFQKGNHVVLEIEDDGKGIDLGKVKKYGLMRGEIGVDEAISDDEILNLLFKPGFSTKESVTELSGRGVGMDVVRKDLENIGGTVEIHTAKDRGTRVTLTLPITLAILQALLVRKGARIFAIPMGSIHETIELGKEKIKTLQGQEVITLRDKTLPIIRLEKLFDLPEIESGNGSFVVVVGMANRTMGLLATELLGKQDIVVKSLGQTFSKNVGLAGAAEMGDQSTILVLDVAGIMMEAIKLGAMSKRV